MKKIILTVSVTMLLMSCSNTQNSTTSSLTNMAASQLLSTLSKNSSLEDITKLFGLLDTNKDNSISEKEAVGDVSSNFGLLDSDKNGGLNLKELGGLLALLK